MREKYKSIAAFGIILFLLTIVEIWADLNGERILVYLTKPLLMPILIVLAYQFKRSLAVYRFRYLVAALVFSWAGDVFLMIREMNLFIPGLLSFLVAHVCYILLFYQDVARKKASKDQLTNWIPSIVFIIFLGTLLSWLLPIMQSNELSKPLIIPVSLYAAVITSMGILAAWRKDKIKTIAFRWGIIGAVSFIISDTILATNVFALPIQYASLWVMSTYVFGQFAITRSVLQSEN